MHGKPSKHFKGILIKTTKWTSDTAAGEHFCAAQNLKVGITKLSQSILKVIKQNIKLPAFIQPVNIQLIEKELL